MKFYGTMICPDCLKAREMLPAAGVEFEYVDITVSTKNLKEFLALRDTRPEFAQIREQGRIGIPCFLKEDGTILLDTNALLEEEKL